MERVGRRYISILDMRFNIPQYVLETCLLKREGLENITVLLIAHQHRCAADKGVRFFFGDSLSWLY